MQIFRGKTTVENEKELREFLCTAKRATYAGKGPENAVPSRPCSHDLNYSEGDFLYIDTFVGGEKFSGEEVVWYKGEPIYSMNYIGRVTGYGFSGDFLKEALKHCTPELPYRGPKHIQLREYAYDMSVEGDIQWFQGYEEITFDATSVYECFFHGGMIK